MAYVIPTAVFVAIVESNNNGEGDTIEFDPTVFATKQRIILTLGELTVADILNPNPGLIFALTINGPGADLLTIDGNNSTRIIFSQMTNGILTVSGITFDNGNSTFGGALMVRNTLEVYECVFRNNRAEGASMGPEQFFGAYGGAIYAEAYNYVIISHSVFSNNEARGAIRVSTNPNAGDSGTAGVGGAAAFAGISNVAVVNSKFSNNVARGASSPMPPVGRSASSGGSAYGGAISGNLFGGVVNSEFENNLAIGGNGAPSPDGISSAGNGGVAYGGAVRSSSLRVLNTSFIGNSVISGNGGSSTSPATVGVAGQAYGGAILDFGNGRIANVTFSSNSAIGGNGRVGGSAQGGAIRVLGDQQFNYANMTVSGNEVIGGAGSQSKGQSEGGGVFVSTSNFTNFRNNIVAQNEATLGPDIAGHFSAALNNLVGNGDGSTGVVNGVNGNIVGNLASPVDPMLGPLGYNGGITRSRALLVGSPAVDAGTNSVLNPLNSQPLSIDQRNFPRIAPVDGTTDIGAYEWGSPKMLPVPLSPDLQGASDTGISNTDNITNARTPIFDVGNIMPGARVDLLRDGIVVSSRFVSPFSIHITDLNAPTDGTALYTSRQIIGDLVSEFSGSLSVTFDNTPPMGNINQAVDQDDPTRLLPIRFTAAFSEQVTGAGAISFDGSTANTSGAFTNSSSLDGITWNVSVFGVTADGLLVRASIVSGSYRDVAGNQGSASTSSDNEVLLDNVRPTVTVNQSPGQIDPTNIQPIRFTAVFSEEVTGLASSDFSFSGSTAFRRW